MLSDSDNFGHLVEIVEVSREDWHAVCNCGWGNSTGSEAGIREMAGTHIDLMRRYKIAPDTVNVQTSMTDERNI